LTKFDLIGEYQKKRAKDIRRNKEFSFDEIALFQQAIYEVHELARKRFLQHHAPEDAELLLDTILAIRDMEERKRTLPVEPFKTMS